MYQDIYVSRHICIKCNLQLFRCFVQWNTWWSKLTAYNAPTVNENNRTYRLHIYKINMVKTVLTAYSKWTYHRAYRLQWIEIIVLTAYRRTSFVFLFCQLLSRCSRCNLLLLLKRCSRCSFLLKPLVSCSRCRIIGAWSISQIISGVFSPWSRSPWSRPPWSR